jgi:hypothetical protein
MKAKESIFKLIEHQETKGIAKYGETVDNNNLDAIEWLNHFQEELVDALFYAEMIKRKIEK